MRRRDDMGENKLYGWMAGLVWTVCATLGLWVIFGSPVPEGWSDLFRPSVAPD